MQTPDFFRARLDGMIDLKHPLAVLATRLPWAQLEAELTQTLTARWCQQRFEIDTQWGCGQNLGLSGDSSCIHTKIEIEPSSSISNSENVLERPFGNWDTRP